MALMEIDDIYITLPEISKITGRNRGTVYSWLKYHRYMDFEYLVPGKPLVKRADFEKFKKEHPELLKAQ